MDSVPVVSDERPVDRRPTLARTILWQPTLVVFISSACMMILELVAGRIVAPYVGVSLYTWTSVIGVVSAGMTLGNYLGGRLADRWASLRLLGGLFLLGGLCSLGVLAVDYLGVRVPGKWHVIARILSLTAAVFFVPSAILGTISPMVAKLALRDLAHSGSTVGKIYAAGAAGSILGTFATGFVLIAWFGTHAIVLGVATLLSVMGLLFLWHGRRVATGLFLVLALGTSAYGYTRVNPLGPCLRQTNYFCIKVHTEEQGGRPVRVLILDRLVHSYTSLDDPTYLVYGYERVYAELAAYQAERHDGLRTLFIGGGGYTFPRYVEAVYPGSKVDVIEIDPGVTQVAYDELGLSRQTPITTFNEDARQFMTGRPDRPYDLILGDAFNDFSVPYHLTTLGFNQHVRDWLAEGGFYMVNLIDGPQREFLRAYVGTLQRTFRYAYVIPAHETWRNSQRTTFVVVATNVAADLANYRPPNTGDTPSLLMRLMLSDADLANVMAEGRTVLLTDDYAPVDQMLATLFRDEGR